MLEVPISTHYWLCAEDERKGEAIKGEPLSSPEYPFFFDDELLAQYQEHQKSYYDIHVMMGGIFTSSCFVLARCNLMHSFEDGNYFIIAFLISTFSYFLFTGLVLCFLAKHCSFNEKGVIAKVSGFILDSPSLINLLRDLMAILGTSGISFGLLGRIANGQCVENVTLWEAQRCNPAAATFGLPLDHAIFLMLSPLLIQAMITGITYRGALTCWFISTAALVACTTYVNGRLELWSFLSCFSVFVLMYRYEKLGRIKFLNSKSTAAAEIEKREHILLQQHAEHNLLSEKIKHESEILNLQSQEECRLMEKEQLQMVAMIGNIAHDLKTPLQSFLMDLESLKGDEGFSKLLKSVPEQSDGPDSIIDSLESTCSFMSMAINRSIDFAKASGNIALVPHMETINLQETLSTAVKIIRHLKSSSEVVVYPFPLTMCPDVITDKHWFKENILCLLSNAIKYSNGGNVTVKITHVTVPQQLSLDYPQSEADFGTLMPYSQPLSYIGSPDDDNNDDDDGGGDNGTVVTSDIPFVNDISANSHHQEKVSHAIASPTGVNCTCLSSEEEPSQLATACYAIIEADAQPVKTDSSSSRKKSSPSSSETSMILITIEDGGIGIPEGVRGELFQPFKQVQRLAGGTGLGLYSLSNRIRALKGMRGVKSRHDGKQGSVFWFAIPYRPDIDHASCNTRRSSIVTTPKISSRKDSMSIDVTSTSHTTATYPSIDSTSPVARLVSAFPMYTSTPATKQGFQFLVVDDSPSILKVITRALTNKKYHVVTADNGSAGLDRLIAGYDNQDFNVVLMDLQMPVMDGIVAVRRYRDFEAKKMEKVVAEESQSAPLRPQELFIIGMSANSDEHTKQCAFDAGMNAFLAKPFTIADLMPVLEHILVTATADE